MRNVMAIAGRELRAYFASPIAYFVIGLFAFIFGWFFSAILSVGIAIRAFDLLTTRIDEWEEIQKRNVAVAIMLAVLILLVGAFMRQGVGNLSRALLPDLPFGEVRGG